MRRAARVWKSTTPWIALGALLLGYLAGQFGSGDAAESAASRQAGATPSANQTADQEEIAALQTQVAELAAAAVCTPAPTATATVVPSPTATATPVAPAPSGVPVPYGSEWTVTVTGLTLTPAIGEVVANGVFAIVSFTAENEGTAEANFPFFDLLLRDEAGREYGLSATGTGVAGIGVFQRYQPGIPAPAAIVFDVAADTGDRFILESSVEPTFRIEVMLTRLG